LLGYLNDELTNAGFDDHTAQDASSDCRHTADVATEPVLDAGSTLGDFPEPLRARDVLSDLRGRGAPRIPPELLETLGPTYSPFFRPLSVAA
jgi:hypothetical protein